MTGHRRTAAALLLVALLGSTACSDDPDEDPATDGEGTSTTTAAGDPGSGDDPLVPVVFGGQGNDLVAYSTQPPFESQRVITNAGDDPDGRDINAQICFWDDPELGRLFVAGEDTRQPDPPAGWGIFRLDGQRVGEFEATQIGKLTPTYQDGDDGAENYGCGLLSDGRMVTTDVGNQATGPGTGQLILWFPPFDRTEVPYCKLDVGIGTAQSIWIDDDDGIWVASSRGAGPEDRPGGVYRYSGELPTGPTPAEGCDGTDPTGAPLATGIARELVIPTDGAVGMSFPAGLAPSPEGGLFVSSVASGVIAEYTLEGEHVRTVLAPPDGEALDADGYSTGSPLGIGVGPDGTLYVADIGVVSTVEDGAPYIGPGDGTGRVLRITFTDGEPDPPETMDDGLAFPDGIGVFVP